MKTVTLIISSLFILMTVSLSAQQHGPQHRGQRGPRNPEEMVKRQVEQMKTELKLNEQQEKQVKDLFTKKLPTERRTHEKISRTTRFRDGQHEKNGRAAKPFSEENLNGRTI